MSSCARSRASSALVRSTCPPVVAPGDPHRLRIAGAARRNRCRWCVTPPMVGADAVRAGRRRRLEAVQNCRPASCCASSHSVAIGPPSARPETAAFVNEAAVWLVRDERLVDVAEDDRIQSKGAARWSMAPTGLGVPDAWKAALTSSPLLSADAGARRAGSRAGALLLIVRSGRGDDARCPGDAGGPDQHCLTRVATGGGVLGAASRAERRLQRDRWK